MKTLTICAIMVALSSGAAFGQTYKVLWSFAGALDGEWPLGSLVADHKGNLYGTTQYGGSESSGTAFELSPQSDGTWTEAVLHNFCSSVGQNGCLDGASPQSSLILDQQGNLYGTTAEGGDQYCPTGGGGCGTVFELSPPALPGSIWTETVLHNFCSVPRQGTNSCVDGFHPVSELTFDGQGNLYGTASEGGSPHSIGSDNTGLVFELSPTPSGWAETVLYNFCSVGTGNTCADGASPFAGVSFDKSGNLYGTTDNGGAGSIYIGAAGVVYRLSPGANGWTETVILTLHSPGSTGPQGMITFDPSGNLYSTFAYGGKDNGGGVFKLDPRRNRAMVVSLPSGNNGAGPTAGVLLDFRRQALYGTSYLGTGSGAVFQVTASGTETTLYAFCQQSNCADGSRPHGGLIEDQLGNLYGTTQNGGANGFGVVFEITP